MLRASLFRKSAKDNETNDASNAQQSNSGPLGWFRSDSQIEGRRPLFYSCRQRQSARSRALGILVFVGLLLFVTSVVVELLRSQIPFYSIKIKSSTDASQSSLTLYYESTKINGKPSSESGSGDGAGAATLSGSLKTQVSTQSAQSTQSTQSTVVSSAVHQSTGNPKLKVREPSSDKDDSSDSSTVSNTGLGPNFPHLYVNDFTDVGFDLSSAQRIIQSLEGHMRVYTKFDRVLRRHERLDIIALIVAVAIVLAVYCRRNAEALRKAKQGPSVAAQYASSRTRKFAKSSCLISVGVVLSIAIAGTVLYSCKIGVITLEIRHFLKTALQDSGSQNFSVSLCPLLYFYLAFIIGFPPLSLVLVLIYVAKDPVRDFLGRCKSHSKAASHDNGTDAEKNPSDQQPHAPPVELPGAPESHRPAHHIAYDGDGESTLVQTPSASSRPSSMGSQTGLVPNSDQGPAQPSRTSGRTWTILPKRNK